MDPLTAVAHPAARGLAYQDFWSRRPLRKGIAGRARLSSALISPAWLGTKQGRDGGVAAVLFLSLFAAQAAVIALTPVLTRVAADLEVSTTVAGQLRTLSGLVAGFVALTIPKLSARAGLRTVLLTALGAIAAGSLASALAPSIEALAAAQAVIGAGIAAVLSAGTAAAAAWTSSEHRTKVLSWALIGQPAAWIVGMPAIGALGEVSWRYGWLVLPLAASMGAALLLSRRAPATRGQKERGLRRAFGDPQLRRWALSELLFNCGWAGTLVYSGSLFVESYGTPEGLTGIALASAAVAYVAGNFCLRRAATGEMRATLVRLSLLLAVGVPLFGVLRTGIGVSAALFAGAAFLAGGRTLLANAYGLALAPRERVAAMGLRAAATQFGYFGGSAVAGVALALGGYQALGLALGAFFVGAAAALTVRVPRRATAVTVG